MSIKGKFVFILIASVVLCALVSGGGFEPGLWGSWQPDLSLRGGDESSNSPSSPNYLSDMKPYYYNSNDLVPVAETWNNKGLVLAQQGKYDEALQAFNKAVELNPQFSVDQQRKRPY
jgi:tetratricopeptide (TPR) repeat protein